MADLLHALFHCRGEKARRRSAPAVFCAGGVLRQSHLSSSCCRRCPRATAPRRQSLHRSTQQTHLDLRPPHHSPSRRQAPNGNRGYEPTQPGDPQPLPQGLPQAIRPRPLPPPHRICDQQYLHRLRHWQGRGESSSIAAEAKRHHRPLSGGAARYFGNLCGPRGTSPTHPAHASSQRQTHPWSEARSTPTVSPHALPGALLLPRRRRHLHYPRLISTDPAGTPGGTGRVQAWIPPLRSLEAARQGLSGKDSSFPSLPASPPRLSNLPGIPEALRKNLCSLDCRHSAALRRGPIHSQRKDHGSRSSIYCCDSGAGRPRRGCRFESSLTRQAVRERNSRLGPYNGTKGELAPNIQIQALRWGFMGAIEGLPHDQHLGRTKRFPATFSEADSCSPLPHCLSDQVNRAFWVWPILEMAVPNSAGLP